MNAAVHFIHTHTASTSPPQRLQGPASSVPPRRGDGMNPNIFCPRNPGSSRAEAAVQKAIFQAGKSIESSRPFRDKFYQMFALQVEKTMQLVHNIVAFASHHRHFAFETTAFDPLWRPK